MPTLKYRISIKLEGDIDPDEFKDITDTLVELDKELIEAFSDDDIPFDDNGEAVIRSPSGKPITISIKRKGPSIS